MTEKGSTEDWQHIQSLFDKILQLNKEDGEALLARQTDFVKSQVREMIAALEQSSHTQSLAEHIFDPLFSDSEPEEGSQLGKYIIKERLASGGMSVVYKAIRQDDITQTVAIKTTATKHMSPENIQRFHLERNLLSQLNHPNIAQIIDAGTQGDIIYSVMEFVDGVPIDQYCAENQLPLKQRLSLLLQVADAVDHAHQMLVVHRDIKPSNVLVNQQGQIKLLDFGIAKPLTHDPSLGKHLETQTGSYLLTPQFAAPEQFTNQPVTVATDVYGMGLLMYLVLTGQHAIPVSHKPWHEASRDIMNHMPPLPSSQVESAGSNAIPAHLLKGDIDAIVIECLKKEPKKRYHSMDSLIIDINNHLSDQPIRIKSDFKWYKLKKFIRRHAALTASVSLTALILITASWLLWSSMLSTQKAMVQAEKERVIANEVSDFLIHTFKAADPQGNIGGNITARELVSHAENTLLAEIEDPDLKNNLVAILGEVLLNMSEFEKAANLFTQYQFSDFNQSLNNHVLLNQVKLNLSIRNNKEASELILKVKPSELTPHELLRFKELEVDIHDSLNMGDQAKNLAQATKEYAKETFGENSLEYAKAWFHQIDTFQEYGNYKESLEASLKILDIVEKHHANQKAFLLRVISGVASFYSKNSLYDDAEAYNKRGLSLASELYQENHLVHASYYHRLGYIEKNRGNHEQAIKYFFDALNIRKKYYGPTSDRLSSLIYSIAWTQSSELQQYQKAIPLFQEALDLIKTNSGNLNNYYLMHIAYIDALIETNQIDKAEELTDAAIAYFIATPKIAQRNLNISRSLKAKILFLNGEHEKAKEIIVPAFNHLEKTLKSGHFWLIKAKNIKQLVLQKG